MKNNITEIVFILDRSGSMYDIASDTIGGFNSTLMSQHKKDGTAFVSTVLFNEELFWLHDRLPIETLSLMTAEDYVPCGCTALLDAIGESIEHIEMIHKYARPEDVPENTIFVIMTDGLENASSKYRHSDIKRMISQKQEENKWEFIFLGANIDAAEEACSIGISRDRATNFHADKVGQAMCFEAADHAIASARCARPIDKSWKAKVEADYKHRRK